jgi:hypothetical protein
MAEEEEKGLSRFSRLPQNVACHDSEQPAKLQSLRATGRFLPGTRFAPKIPTDRPPKLVKARSSSFSSESNSSMRAGMIHTLLKAKEGLNKRDELHGDGAGRRKPKPGSARAAVVGFSAASVKTAKAK